MVYEEYVQQCDGHIQLNIEYFKNSIPFYCCKYVTIDVNFVAVSRDTLRYNRNFITLLIFRKTLDKNIKCLILM